eukprot:4471295-Prymnesium_polylepis.1
MRSSRAGRLAEGQRCAIRVSWTATQLFSQASEKCLSYLRDGNRVLPPSPTAAECGAPVGRKQVRE